MKKVSYSLIAMALIGALYAALRTGLYDFGSFLKNDKQFCWNGIQFSLGEDLSVAHASMSGVPLILQDNGWSFAGWQKFTQLMIRNVDSSGTISFHFDKNIELDVFVNGCKSRGNCLYLQSQIFGQESHAVTYQDSEALLWMPHVGLGASLSRNHPTDIRIDRCDSIFSR